MMYRLLIALFITVVTLNANSQANAQSQTLTPKLADPIKNSAVVSAHPLATQVGKEILDAGGNAFDAAVAVSAALGVVEPSGSGIGGGGFWLIYHAEQDRYVMVDARETAPLEARRDMYLHDDGSVNQKASKEGALAAGIPGLPKAYDHIAHRYGSMPLSKLLQPAINLAQNGFRVDKRHIAGIDFKQNNMRAFPETASIFLDNNNVPEVGWVLKQPSLAKTLSLIAEKGAQGFYEGDFAQSMVKSVRDNGGIWTLEDLASYTIIEREPVIIDYKGARFVMTGLPSSGGLVIAQALKILEQFDPEQFDLENLDDIQSKRLIVEAMRAAFADRGAYMGDPDFLEQDLGFLLSAYRVNQKARAIKESDHAVQESLTEQEQSEGMQTTHFAVKDNKGNRVAVTQSLNLWFGSNFMPENTGVLLNNQMDDFSSKIGAPDQYGLISGEANAIAPRKRMLSSMTPMFIDTNDKALILGTPGGSRIITMNLLASLYWLGGASLEDIMAKQRYHHQYLPDIITYEEGAFTAQDIDNLSQRGYVFEKANRPFGNMQLIEWDKDTGDVSTVSDPRGLGDDTHVY